MEDLNVKSKKLMCIAAFAALVVLVAIMFFEKKARGAQVQSSTSPVTHPSSGEVGAAPDATYGEALETPNHRRQRLAAETAQAGSVPSPEQYPFADAVHALEESPIKATQPRSAPQDAGKKTARSPRKRVPAEPSVPDSATGRDAVEVSNRWQNLRDTPADGNDGRVVYSYGGGLATIVCAPLRMCVIELQSGEKLTGQPHIGDAIRWNVEPASYGPAERATLLIVLKPKAVGLDTNLIITTDRRSYYLRLLSSSQDYVAKVSFEYPDDERSSWSEAISKQDEAARDAKFEKEVKTLANSVEDLNVDYKIKGDKNIRPIRVLDDGVHTYLQMNSSILHREAPVLAVIGPDGKAEIVNYRVQGSVYIVDRLFDRARLILGSGRKARKADIISGIVKVHRLFARDPFRRLAKGGDSKEEQPQ